MHADDSNVFETDRCEGTQGEILVKSPSIFKCYYNNPSATTESFVEGVYFLFLYENKIFIIQYLIKRNHLKH